MWTAERRPCEDAARRQSSVSQAESQENQTCGTLMLDFLSPEPCVIHTQTHTHTHIHTARSDQSIIKEINPEYSLEGLMLNLKLQYLGHLMWRANCLERPRCWGRLRAREGGHREWNGWMSRLTQWTRIWADSGRCWGTGKSGVLQFIGSPRSRHNMREQQQQQHTHTHTHTHTHIHNW